MTNTHQIAMSTTVFNREWLKRVTSVVAILAVVAAAIGLPVITPNPAGVSPVLAIARADCPPDCGPGGGGNPSGPPGGGTEFVPPSMPATPSYEPGRGYPAPDQNNSVSIYNSAAPQPSQAAQPNQQSAQNQDGSYNRAANGEQQPNNYQQAPNNQQINNDWQKLSDQLNKQQSSTNQDGGNQNSQNKEERDQQDCSSIMESLEVQRDSIIPSPEEIEQARQSIETWVQQTPSYGDANSGGPIGQPAVPSFYDPTALDPAAEDPVEIARKVILQQIFENKLAENNLSLEDCQEPAAAEVELAQRETAVTTHEQPSRQEPDWKDPLGCPRDGGGPPSSPDDLEQLNSKAVIDRFKDMNQRLDSVGLDPVNKRERDAASTRGLADIGDVPDFSRYDPSSLVNGDNGEFSFSYVDEFGETNRATATPNGQGLTVRVFGAEGMVQYLYVQSCHSYVFTKSVPPPDVGFVYPDEVSEELLNALVSLGLDLTASAAKGIVRMIAGWWRGRAERSAIAKGIEAAEARAADADQRLIKGWSGRKGYELSVPRGTNPPATINGRYFTGHALDQMQARGIPPTVVDSIVSTVKPVAGNKPGTLLYIDPVNKIWVVTNTKGDVVTVSYGKS
ncbi:hypothetical protein [Mycobacterium sp. NPDC050853]|uniref:hypothetical protein n=1 Tax=Mycobacterium sp. NPDC050853 TaxID=3155160 RepID=UPI0033FEED7D